MLPVAILAGGQATRLHPLTEHVPKSLLPIAGRPFLFHQLELLRQEGLSRVVLCVGHLAEQIAAAAGDGSRWGLSIAYSCDGLRPRGTGGALRQALPLLGEEFFVLYGDSYVRCSFAQLEAAYFETRAPALMAVLRNDNRWDRSNVRFRMGTCIEYDKQAPRTDFSHIDFGVSVLSSTVLAGYPQDAALDLADVYADLSRRDQLAGYEVRQRFYEIGSREGIAETERFLSQGVPAV
jgi:NDP-sugar pyrophosphorylase family protein